MGLLGETLGLLGLTRWSLLAAAYYVALLLVGIVTFAGAAASPALILTIIGAAAFVILFVTLYMRQNEARQQAQALAAELETANRRLAAYAAQVEDLTLAAERQRMARELHDTLAQGVAGLVLQLEAVKAHQDAGRPARAEAIVVQALARARSTLADSRAAIDDLRAVPAGLPEAIRALVERFTWATGIPCDLALDLGEDRPILPAVGEHVQRIVSEGLSNVTRHARATRVGVRCAAGVDALELTIDDDGQGFDPDLAAQAGHYGLLGMRERARLVGGRLTIESEPGQGTRLHLSIPLAPRLEQTPAAGQLLRE